MTLPQGWEEAPLLDVVELHDSRRVPLNAAERAAMLGSYPYYGANGQVGSVGDFLFEGKHILVAEDGGYFDQPERGVAYEVDGRFWVNNHAHILSTCGDMPTGFITRLLNTIDWLKYVSGTTRLKLTQGGMQRIRLPIPPLAEQRRIVAKLDALTARLTRARSELDRVPVLAANLRKETLRNAFGQGATTVPVGELITDIRYGTAKKCDYGGGAVPVLRIPNVQGGRIDLGDMKSASFDAKELAKLMLRHGDILVIRSNGSLDLVGRSAIVDDSAAGMLFAGYLIRMRVEPAKCLAEYLHHFLQSPAARDTIMMAAKSTSGVNNVNAQQLQALAVPLPDLSTQRSLIAQIEQSLARADRLEAEATRARALLDRLESALLAKAFRGELVPQDPNDEPAQTLLDRIRSARELARAAAPKTKRGRKARVAA